MASNPMQRKTRNAFLLGIIVTLLVASVVIAGLLLMLKQKNEELQVEKLSRKKVYVLTQDVKAAEIITRDMVELKSMNADSIPSNATSVSEVVDTWFLQTEGGEYIYRDQHGLYLDKQGDAVNSDKINEIFKNKEQEIQIADDKVVKINEYYTYIDGEIVKVNLKQNENGILQADSEKGNDEVLVGDFYAVINGKTKKVTEKVVNELGEEKKIWVYVDKDLEDNKTRIYQEANSYEFYKYKTIADTKIIDKEYIGINDVPVIARIDMMANTVMTRELVVKSDEIVTDDTREEEYNMITLPIDLMPNDYVDIRLKTPSGQNFIVISKVQVDVPMNADGRYIANTIRVKLREDEILLMSSAIVEAYGIDGAGLYVTKYVDPAMQIAATPTYIPNAAVTAQINANPNIVEIAKQELAKIGTNAAIEARNKYLQQMIDSSTGYWSNIPGGLDSSVGTSIVTRQQYLNSLTKTK